MNSSSRGRCGWCLWRSQSNPALWRKHGALGLCSTMHTAFVPSSRGLDAQSGQPSTGSGLGLRERSRDTHTQDRKDPSKVHESPRTCCSLTPDTLRRLSPRSHTLTPAWSQAHQPLENQRMRAWKAMCIPMSQALFTRAKGWEPARCTSVDKLILPEPGTAQRPGACLASISPLRGERVLPHIRHYSVLKGIRF